MTDDKSCSDGYLKILGYKVSCTVIGKVGYVMTPSMRPVRNSEFSDPKTFNNLIITKETEHIIRIQPRKTDKVNNLKK